MTKPARIHQLDLERALRAARRQAPGSRVIIDLARQRVEIELSPAESASPANDGEDNPWEQDDGPA